MLIKLASNKRIVTWFDMGHYTKKGKRHISEETF